MGLSLKKICGLEMKVWGPSIQRCPSMKMDSTAHPNTEDDDNIFENSFPK